MGEVIGMALRRAPVQTWECACGGTAFELLSNGLIECVGCRKPSLSKRWFDPAEPPPRAG